MNWKAGSVFGGRGEEHTQIESIFELRDQLFLTQVIDTPTRENSGLDLCFTNNIDLVMNIEMEDTINSDHRLIVLNTNISRPLSLSDKESNSGFGLLNFFSDETD